MASFTAGAAVTTAVAGTMADSRMERPTSTGARSTMSRQSGRGTVDQESVGAGEMGSDTARDDQQQIVDKAHITEGLDRQICLSLCT